MKKLYFMSFGIHTPLGFSLLSHVLLPKEVEDKKILLIAGEHDWLVPYLEKACIELGFAREHISIIYEGQKKSVIRLFLTFSYDYIYVTEGNTFYMLQFMREHQLIHAIKEQIKYGASYIGVSAGAYIAGIDITTAIPFDSNRVNMTDYTGLALFRGVTIPHFDAMDKNRFQAYKEAKMSGKYEKVYTIRDDEILVEVLDESFE